MLFRYNEESNEFVNEALARFASSKNFVAIVKVQDYLSHLEDHCRNTAFKLLDDGQQNPRYRNYWLDDFRRLSDLIPFEVETVDLKVPLNSLAVITVLFDLMISPQRSFRQAHAIFDGNFRQAIEIRGGLDEMIFNDEVAATLEREEADFWSLFNLFVEQNSSLLEDQRPFDVSSRFARGFEDAMRSLFDYAAHAAALPLVIRIKGENNGLK